MRICGYFCKHHIVGFVSNPPQTNIYPLSQTVYYNRKIGFFLKKKRESKTKQKKPQTIKKERKTTERTGKLSM